MENFGVKLATLTKAYAGIFSNQLSDVSINRNYYALAVLWSKKKPINQKQLSEILEKDKVSVVRIVDHLSSHGMVERQINPVDRREQFIVLTDKGREVGKRAKQALVKTDDIMFAHFSDDERATFQRLIDQIHENFGSVQRDTYDLNFKKLKR
jgi:DNA-binding MarR family transcriptional regulator